MTSEMKRTCGAAPWNCELRPGHYGPHDSEAWRKHTVGLHEPGPEEMSRMHKLLFEDLKRMMDSAPRLPPIPVVYVIPTKWAPQMPTVKLLDGNYLMTQAEAIRLRAMCKPEIETIGTIPLLRFREIGTEEYNTPMPGGQTPAVSEANEDGKPRSG